MKEATSRFFATLLHDLLMVLQRFTKEADPDDTMFLVNLAETMRSKTDRTIDENKALSKADLVLAKTARKTEECPAFAETLKTAFQSFVTETMEYVSSLSEAHKEKDAESCEDFTRVVLFYRGILEHVRVWCERNNVELGAQVEYAFDDKISVYAPKYAGNTSCVECSILADLSPGTPCLIWEPGFLRQGDFGRYAAPENAKEEQKPAVEEFAVEEPVEEIVSEDAAETIEEFFARLDQKAELSQEEVDEIHASVEAYYANRPKPVDPDEEFCGENEGEYDPTDVATDEEANEPRDEETSVEKPVPVPTSPTLPGFELFAERRVVLRKGNRTRENSILKIGKDERLQKIEDAQILMEDVIFHRSRKPAARNMATA